MRRATSLLALALASAQLVVVAPGRAQTLGPTLPDYEPVVPPKPQPPLATPSTFIDRDMTRPWSVGHVRDFLAVTVDVGYLYLRPKLSLGYGRPYSSWIGLDLAPVVSSFEVAAYGGLRALFGPIDFRAGARYNFPYYYNYLAQEPSYSRLDLESTVGGRATYEALETELKTSIGVGPGSVLAIASMFYLLGVPAGFDVYEDTLHTIARPPLVAWGRSGYDFHFGTQGQHGIAVVGDVLYSPDRDATTVRAGLLLHIAFSHHFEIRGSFVPTVWSKDSIGLAGDDFTELGLRYRWATGD
jgi:hypothetical protein